MSSPHQSVAASPGATSRPPASKEKRFDEKSAEDLAKEQGIGPMVWEKHFGAGRDLWESEAEFGEFLASMGRLSPKRG